MIGLLNGGQLCFAAMAGNHKKLTETAREEASRSDPARKRQLLDMVAELDNLLPRQVIAVKGALQASTPLPPPVTAFSSHVVSCVWWCVSNTESLQNPGNEEKLEALCRAVDSSRAAVCNLQDALHPTPATAADKLAARELAELSTLQVPHTTHVTTHVTTHNTHDTRRTQFSHAHAWRVCVELC
jgi:hypothetical protein